MLKPLGQTFFLNKNRGIIFGRHHQAKNLKYFLSLFPAKYFLFFICGLLFYIASYRRF